MNLLYHFRRHPMTYVIFHDFPRLENGLIKLCDFRLSMTGGQLEFLNPEHLDATN